MSDEEQPTPWSVPLSRPEGRSEPDHTRINCPLPNVCFWHRPPHPGLSDLTGRLPHERHEDKLGGFGVFSLTEDRYQSMTILCDRLESLAQRWMKESERCKSYYDNSQPGQENDSFRRSMWQQYVDYERQATELRLVIKYSVEI